MIITKFVQQTMSGVNMKHYRSLGYDIKPLDKITIPVEHLPIHSRCTIEVTCDRCDKELSMNYATYNKYFKKQGFYSCIKCKTEKTINTNKLKYGVEHVSQDKNVKKKLKLTNLKKYGVESVLQNTFFLNKMKKTNLKKYGVEYVSKLDYIQNICKNTRIKRGYETPDEIKGGLRIYRLLVDKATRKFKKELFKKWNGYDYYDNNYIKNNLKLSPKDRNYPCVDHKISVFFGYNNKIPAEEIGHLSNLCITKRWINSKKHSKNKIIL